MYRSLKKKRLLRKMLLNSKKLDDEEMVDVPDHATKEADKIADDAVKKEQVGSKLVPGKDQSGPIPTIEISSS